MDKNTKPELPVLGTTDADGVQWEYDANKDRWSATVAGKKMSSTYFDKLRDKVIAATPKAAPAEVPPTEPAPRQVEVAMIAIDCSSGLAMRDRVNLLDEKIKFSPIVVKMEWNVAKGAMEVVRYKGADGGWKQRNTNDQILFHPSSIPDEVRDLIERSTRGRMISRLYQDAQDKIAKAWWSSKPDQTQAWEIVNNQGIKPSAQMVSSGNSKNLAYTNPAWTLAGPEVVNNASGWKQQPTGELRRGQVTIKMEVPGCGWPIFELYTQGHDHPLLSDRDLSKVIALGNATHFINKQPSCPHIEWVATRSWNAPGKTVESFPIRRQVHGAALFESTPTEKYSHRGYPEAYVLSVDAPETMSSKTSDYQNPGTRFCWRSSNPHYHAPSIRHTGPEDACLQPLVDLRMTLASFEPDPFDLNSLTAITPASLAYVAGLIEDGEELTTDPQVMVNQVKTIIDRVQARVCKQEDLVAWQQRCADTAAAALDALAQYAPSVQPDPRKPKP